MIAHVLRRVTAIRYVMPLREGGSLPGLVEADDDGLYVVKFRAAGQGVKALVAEVVAAGIGRALGLPIPDTVAVELDPVLGRAEPDPEIAELVSASAGLNFGIDFLPGALDLNPARPVGLDSTLASEIVWFDALLTNVDRTPRNPNLLVWHGRVWLIDHGAALYHHHAAGDRLLTRAREPFPLIADHVLLPLATEIGAVDVRLAARLTPQTLEQVLAEVPDTWLSGDPEAARRMYAAYLAERLRPPRGFAQEARLAHGA